MHDQRHCLQVVPIGAVHALPARHLGFTRLHHGLRLLDVRTTWMGRLARAEVLLSLAQGLARLSQTTAYGERIALDQLLDEVKQIRYTQTLQACFGQLHQRLCPVTHQGEHPGSQRLEPCLDQSVPGVIAAILGDLFKQQVATHQVHEHQHHTLQEGFVHRPDDGSHLSISYPLVLPGFCGLQDRLLQRLHHPSHSAGRTASMRLKAQTTEKLADRFGANASLEAEGIERRHDEADEPTAACCRFPPPGLWVLISAFHRLFEAMYTALGEPSPMGNLSDALLRVVTKRVENPKTFGPKSPVGLSSDGRLNSWSNPAPQRTGPTPNCPALDDFPVGGSMRWPSHQGEKTIETTGVWLFGGLTVLFALGKVLGLWGWSWGHVVLRMLILLVFNVLYIAIGLLYLSVFPVPERPAAEETVLLRTDTDTAHYWAGLVLCAGFVLNVVRRVEQAEVSTGWWLCAGRVEVLIAFGTFSVISLWLYWSRIGSLLHQAEDSHS